MPTQGPSPSPPQGQRATGWWSMPFSFETFAWAVSALFQLLAVCAYLLSFPHVDGVCDQLPDIDGVDDQLPDMPEVIQDSAIEMKITYSGIIFVFGFYTQVVVLETAHQGAFRAPRELVVIQQQTTQSTWTCHRATGTRHPLR